MRRYLLSVWVALLVCACGDAGPFQATERWQLVGPDRGEVDLGVVGASERVIVAPINAEEGRLEVQVTATGLVRPSIDVAASSLAATSGPAMHPALVATGAILAGADPTPESFCILERLDPRTPTRRPAKKVLETAHATWFVDIDDQSFFEEITPRIWQRIATRFEERLWPALTHVLGEPVRGGKIRVFFSRAIGTAYGGYFDARDLTRLLDTSADCSGTASNGGNTLYQNALNAAGTPDEMIDGYYPSSLAHELTHLLHFHRRCGGERCDRPEETWISEGLAKVGEDLAGGGWNLPAWRRVGAQLSDGGYAQKSLTDWDGETVGHYEQAHALLRYWVDRHGGDVLRAASSGDGRERLLELLGVDFATLLAQYATALIGVDPVKTFANDSAWAPFSEKVGGFNARLLPSEPVVLPGASWIAFEAVGEGVPASLKITGRGDRPHLLVLRVPAN